MKSQASNIGKTCYIKWPVLIKTPAQINTWNNVMSSVFLKVKEHDFPVLFSTQVAYQIKVNIQKSFLFQQKASAAHTHAAIDRLWYLYKTKAEQLVSCWWPVGAAAPCLGSLWWMRSIAGLSSGPCWPVPHPEDKRRITSASLMQAFIIEMKKRQRAGRGF